jgi:signal transduction histidine kinase
MSSIIIPMVIDDEVLGTIENREFISIDGPDMAWHEAAVERLGIEADIYYRALEEVPVFTEDRIRAITGLLQVIIQLAEEQIQRSRMMARLQATKEAAEEANQAKSEFVSLVAHELKNPMTTVKGFIDLLLHLNERGEPSKTTLNEYLLRSLNGVRRMESLIKDLSDLSQIEAGYLQLKLEALSLREVLAESIEAVELQMDDKSQQLVQRIPEELPPVQADRARLGQIIMNLLSNACKYTPEGGKITVYVEPWDKAVHIAVQDNGMGIQQKDQSQIFEKFFRSAEVRTQTLPGTGLGLNITRNLIEMHGGRIWFESELHRGSTFHFTLPVGEEEKK